MASGTDKHEITRNEIEHLTGLARDIDQQIKTLEQAGVDSPALGQLKKIGDGLYHTLMEVLKRKAL